MVLGVISIGVAKILQSFQDFEGLVSDLASVHHIQKVSLEKINNASKIKGQLVPFVPYHLAGQIQALPEYFTDTFPRNNIGTKAYSVIGCQNADLRTNITAYQDVMGKGKVVDVFMHELRFND